MYSFVNHRRLRMILAPFSSAARALLVLPILFFLAWATVMTPSPTSGAQNSLSQRRYGATPTSTSTNVPSTASDIVRFTPTEPNSPTAAETVTATETVSATTTPTAALEWCWTEAYPQQLGSTSNVLYAV